VLGRLTARFGEPLAEPAGTITHRFPTAAALADLEPAELPFPRRRAEALRELARLVAREGVRFDAGADASAALAALLEIPGVGPWTASYVAMRALGDPDAFLPGDVGVRHALERLGHDPGRASTLAEAWRPWRSYAVMHLWALVSAQPDRRLVADQVDQVAERDVRVDQVQSPGGVGRRVEHRRAA
jgi:AraC family transcriptional regulator of adaptative response / DNA-3-methyladenine glycosylase II